MNSGWQIKQLGDLCRIQTGKKDVNQGNPYGAFPFFTCAAEHTFSDSYSFDDEALLIAGNGDVGNVSYYKGKFEAYQRTYVLTGFAEVLPRFLYLILDGKLKATVSKQKLGNTMPYIKVGMLADFQLPVPPLLEQQRIVGILDEAFDGIATAKANAEKNLQNARVLFESHLQSVFTQRGEGWVGHALGDVCDFVGGSQPPKSVFSKTKTADNIRLIQIRDYKSDKHIVYIPRDQARRFCSADDVMIGRYGPPLFQILRGLEGAYNVALMKAVPDEKRISRDFLYYFLKHSSMLEYVIYHSSRAAGQIGVTKETLAPYPIHLPSLATQKMIVETIVQLETETQRLESLYQQKLAALDELKQSLLHQALSGELTKSSAPAIVITFPTKISSIGTTDLHAGILAMGYQLHEAQGKQGNFGHVKAEKIAHMIEAHVGINLDRNPIKDAAGPNDFAHLKKVESRAHKAGYFDFKRVGKAAYRVVKHSRFDSLIAQAQQALGDRLTAVNQLLKLMLPMDTQQAEIFCTVYAAWNNLLLDGSKPNDEAIVFEARENWHSDKLKIERQKFFAALSWLREQGIVPEGKGKRVVGKGK